MLALRFTFPAGRYHATPWDRHVNEGAVAWPPEPWRILRALIATWHHKLEHRGTHQEDTLDDLIDTLASELPTYHLPAASHSHTRHFMPIAAGKTTKVLDAFVAVKRDDPLTVIWAHLELLEPQRQLLDDLLPLMGYLGRAESWVEAERITDLQEVNEAINCKVAEQTADDVAPHLELMDATSSTAQTHRVTVVDSQTGELQGERISLYAPLPEDKYAALRQTLPDTLREALSVDTATLRQTLPDTLREALSVDTATLREVGWSQPPAARKVSYLRPLDALRPQPRPHRVKEPTVVHAVSFMLLGKPLPRVEDTLRIGELIRMATMSRCKNTFGEAQVPWMFSGHNLPHNQRLHQHAFYLPWDSNNDGKLDRVLVHVPAGMKPSQQGVLTQLHKLFSRGGSEWHLVVEAIGDTHQVAPKLMQPSNTWVSVTPYLHPWHRKTSLNVVDQIRRECMQRGLPELVMMQPLEAIEVAGRTRRPVHFHRFRQRRGLMQPDRHGSFWKLTFEKPVNGPLALGFACHFGLGLFKPDGSS